MGKNFVDFILDCCPLLQVYVNVSYNKVHSEETTQQCTKKQPSKKVKTAKVEENLFPYEDIYLPD